MMRFAKVGVLGTGEAGRRMADGFLALGLEVRMGGRAERGERAVEWAGANGPRASFGTFRDAARFGDLVVLATLGKETEAAIAMAGEASFGQKIVLDLTNPVDYVPPEPPALFVGTTDSLGERVQRALPFCRVVKAFNTVGAMHFFRPEFAGGPADMFLAGDDFPAKEAIGEVVRAFGWGVADAGGIAASRWLEPLFLVWVTYALANARFDHALRIVHRPGNSWWRLG
jgi:hypothetical protein